MRWIDWLIMALPLIVCASIAVYSRRYVRSVADFMAGGRHAGRFLICAARSEQGAGAVGFVAAFQQFYRSGFTLTWWSQISVPVGLLVAITGFVTYRYRQTRAMTLAQFFQMRYGRKFRLFTGALGFLAGLVNFGVIPVIGARFMVFFLQFPQTVQVFSFTIPTYLLLMATFLSISVLMTTTGGQVSVLLADCAEGMISQVFYTFIAITMLVLYFHWPDTRAVLLNTPPTRSLVNPFASSGIEDFNVWLIVMATLNGLYRTGAWQNSHAFNSSAASPHESRMGSILGRWRSFAIGVMITLLGVCAMTYLKSGQGAAHVQGALATVADPSTRDQMRLPVVLSQILPMCVKGMLMSVLVMGIISGDGIHLHSWGSILVQDVIMPLRKTPTTTRQHLTLLRWAIVGVAVWAFLFGSLFTQTRYVGFWFAVTEGIFTGGAGVAILGGLYWSRGTSAGAWAGTLVGSILAVGGMACDWYVRTCMGHDFFLNGVQISFFSGALAVATYVIVSWLTCKQPHDMDQLLHRGRYAVEAEAPADAPAARKQTVSWVYRVVGIDEQFNPTDRRITLGIFWWSITWFLVFAVGSLAYLLLRKLHGGTNADYNVIWADYWLWTAIYLPLLLGATTTVWFTIGSWHDMRTFFQRLRKETIDVHDDGSVDRIPAVTDPKGSGEAHPHQTTDVADTVVVDA